MIRKYDTTTVIETGSGDVTAGYGYGEYKPGVASIAFWGNPCGRIGEEPKENPPGMPGVRLTFSNTQAIDILMHHLSSCKKEMEADNG